MLLMIFSISAAVYGYILKFYATFCSGMFFSKNRALHLAWLYSALTGFSSRHIFDESVCF